MPTRPTLQPIVYGQLEEQCDGIDESGEAYPTCANGLKCLERFIEGSHILEKVCLDPRTYKAPIKTEIIDSPVVSSFELQITEYCYDGTEF